MVKRLGHSNPNVQLLTLTIFDICVKNGGTPFLLQVGGKECTTELVGLSSGYKSGSNREVMEKALSKIQDWATAFKGKEGLRDTYLVETYNSMKLQGSPFPPLDATATAAFVDSLSVSLRFISIILFIIYIRIFLFNCSSLSTSN